MFISRVSEEGGMGEDQEVCNEDEMRAHDFHTANELFELMARNHNFHPSENEYLTTRDLVLLYKNIDLGTQLMSNANEIKKTTPNQYVETIVYKEDHESDSDLSEIYSSEDLQNVVLINKERIDLLNNSSIDKTLCPKLGDIEMQTANLSSEYNHQFIFKDPYIKEQLKNFSLNSNEHNGSLLPASLLDYICCKRLEDNYNFYMENIIKYVKHTIDQLKRISNGDYLTDKAKEKWKEVEEDSKENQLDTNNTKVLAASTSIPLHIERKVNGHASKWDDIVHSEIDIRSLSKILEKKIIVEIPKLLCDYRLVSKCLADNLIIRCKKESQVEEIEHKEEKSRVDVVFHLSRSESGHVISNINSIMILQKSPRQPETCVLPEVLPLPYKNVDERKTIEYYSEKEVRIVELDNSNKNKIESCREAELDNIHESTISRGENGFDSDIESNIDNESSRSATGYRESSESTRGFRINTLIEDSEAYEINVNSPDELSLTIQRLNIQSSVPEESVEGVCLNTTVKRKSPTRYRIKSPYENKSYIIEEKKRKKLLEIRQRREKNKMAMSENSKVSKHKCTKGVIMPQSSNSVTKLSITNKSFYNSIYGPAVNTNTDNKMLKNKERKDKKDSTAESMSDTFQVDEDSVNQNQTVVIHSQKFINRSYYLDDTLTEMMYMQMKNSNRMKEVFSESTSAVSTDYNSNLKPFSQLLITPSVSEIKIRDEENPSKRFQRFNDVVQNADHNSCLVHQDNSTPSHSTHQLSSKHNMINEIIDIKCERAETKKPNPIEFKESIDKIYDLIKKLEKTEAIATKPTKSKFTATGAVEEIHDAEDCGSSVAQCSDSGTSIKHHLTSSNPSYFSFEKPTITTTTNKKQPNSTASVVPKVIISTKPQIPKADGETIKKDRKRRVGSPPTRDLRENPLKAISQLLQEFDKVQNTKKNSANETKPLKNPKKDPKEIAEGKSSIRVIANNRKQLRFEQNIKDVEPLIDNNIGPRTYYRDRRPRPPHLMEQFKFPHQNINLEEKRANKFAKKQVPDIIDEVKEARGEAVRGPSKPNSRLNSLAQPKKSYVQAQIDEFQYRRGKNYMITDRLQKLAAGPSSQNIESVCYAKQKNKRCSNDVGQNNLIKSPTQPPDKSAKLKHMISNKLESKNPSSNVQSRKQSSIPETPDAIKKKMVTVESYVKNHYGRRSPTEDIHDLLRGHKSRVPLLPNDIELSSMTSSPSPEESNAIGSKLHNLIDSLMNPSPPVLTVLTECNETNSKVSKEDIMDALSLAENVSKEAMSLDSDYRDDEFQDKHLLTIIENCKNEKENEKVGEIPQIVKNSSCFELEKLENALYRRISLGTFQKRLRLKNLTLTPKQSMQQVLLLQSGDSNSIVLKSTRPQNLKVSHSKSETASDFKTLAGISEGFHFAKFPIQIATIGYTFPLDQSVPHYKTTEKNTTADKLSVITSLKSYCKLDKTSQCFKGRQTQPRLEHGAQVDIKDFIVTPPITEIKSGVVPEVINATPLNEVDIKSASLEIKTIASNQTSMSREMVNVKSNENPCNAQKPVKVDYTTSLDILAGLLNEIQKITACQTQMTSTESNYMDDVQCKEVKAILNDVDIIENTMQQSTACNVISISSLDMLTQLESDPSIFSFYVSNDDKEAEDTEIGVGGVPTFYKPNYADKEVNVEFPIKEYVNRFTDAPSRLIPEVINHSTNVSKSLIGVLSQPSSQSIWSFTDNNSQYPKSTLASKKIIDLPQFVAKSKESFVTLEDKKESSEKMVQKAKMEGALSENVNNFAKLHKLNKIECKKNVNNDYFDIDSGMKMKRDILVAVYSVLVFTVFAALSFPEIMLYRA